MRTSDQATPPSMDASRLRHANREANGSRNHKPPNDGASIWRVVFLDDCDWSCVDHTSFAAKAPVCRVGIGMDYWLLQKNVV
ncbi:hypothetical protein VDGL01_12188 [Verticillium dahliae]